MMNDGPGVVVMQELGKAGITDVEQRFKTRGYGTWAPLKPATIARKGHDTILVDTGTMKDSVGIGIVTANKVTVTVPHATRDKRTDIPGYHQRGSQHLPQRKIVEVTSQLQDRLRPIVKEWLNSWRT